MSELVKKIFNESRDNSRIPKSEQLKKIEKLAGDASSREYYRINTTTGSYIACLEKPEGGIHKKFLAIQEILQKSGVRVPKVYDTNLSEGYILQEDLGDKTLQEKAKELKNRAQEMEIYNKALGEMIKIHQTKNTGHESFSLAFDEKKLMEEVDFTLEHLFKIMMNSPLSKKDETSLRKSYLKICQTIASQKRVYTHRDYHSRNIIIKNGNAFILDFQDARMGIPQYDLVSLLEDCYSSVSSRTKDSLKKSYLDFSKSSPSEFERIYHYMNLQRTFKAMGSFAYIHALKGDEQYLLHIDKGFEKIKKSLDTLNEFQNLTNIFSRVRNEH